MKKLLAVLLLSVASMCSGPVAAGYTMATSEGVVRLEDAPCKDPAMLDQVWPQFHKDFKEGYVEIKGKRQALCWDAEEMERAGSTTLINPLGGRLLLPESAFKKDVGV